MPPTSSSPPLTSVRRFLHADVLVVGSTVHAVAAALACAAAGGRTALIMRTASPATEFGASMGAWITAWEADALPDALRPLLLAGAEPPVAFDDESVTLLHQTRAITELENSLLDAGVRLFYGAHPLGLLTTDDGADVPQAAGVLVGGKFGVAAATGSVVVDATVDGRLARSSGRGRWVTVGGAGAAAAEGDAANQTVYAGCFLTGEAAWLPPTPFAVDPAAPGGLTVTRRGRLAEFRFTLPAAAPGEPEPQPERWLRRALVRELPAWNQRHPAAPLTLERAGDDLLELPARRLAARGLATPATTGVGGFYCLGPIADGLDPSDTPMEDYLDHRTHYMREAWRDLPAALEAAATETVTEPEPSNFYCLLPNRVATPTFTASSASAATLDADADLRLTDAAFDEPDCDTIQVALPAIPVIASADLAVSGGGTSGQIAALQAGRLGVATVCLEMHADIGGVNTVGGVPAYWYGRWTPFFKRLHAEQRDRIRSAGLPVALAMFALLDEAGVDLRLRCPTVGVAMSPVAPPATITHLLCATRGGLAAVAAPAFVDASGDGDVAAWAGAPYSYGTERDEITMWCSFGSFRHHRQEAFRQYMSVVDQRSIHDTARGIIAGRRMAGATPPGEYLQHFLATRESRHIRGATTVTYLDVMMERAFPDAVMACKSNLDIKGMAASRAVLCGFIERAFHQNYEVTLPYRALTPPSLPNLLVIGKAYSITHDALAMARMQPDMMSLGAVAAHAVALARETGSSLAAADVARLQMRLLAAGLLLPGDLPHGPLDERLPPDAEALTELLERLDSKPMEPSEWARVLSCADAQPDLLGQHGLVQIPFHRKQHQRLAAAVGDPRANDALLAQLDALLGDGPLPDAADLLRRHDMPDHGFAPEPVYLLNLLAGTGEPRLVSRLQHVAERLEIDPACSDYRFNYIHAIAYAAEHLATPEAGAIALALLQRPAIAERLLLRSHSGSDGGSGAATDPRPGSDYIAERFAYLGLCLARGAARCGLRAGFEGLAAYTGESRLYLARSARAELHELLGVDCAFSAAAWRRVIADRATFTPSPYATPRV